MITPALKRAAKVVHEQHALFRDPKYGTELVLSEYEEIGKVFLTAALANTEALEKEVNIAIGTAFDGSTYSGLAEVAVAAIRRELLGEE